MKKKVAKTSLNFILAYIVTIYCNTLCKWQFLFFVSSSIPDPICLVSTTVASRDLLHSGGSLSMATIKFLILKVIERMV